MPVKKDVSIFKKELYEKYGNTITLVGEYINNNTKTSFLCDKHGPFEKTPKDLMKQSCKGCQKCYEESRISDVDRIKEMFAEKHGDFYTYDFTTYTKSSEKMRIVCPVHGEFYQSPSEHLKYKCKKCATDSLKKQKEYYIEKFISTHGDKYNYSESNIEGHDSNITIICPTHGSFTQSVYHHYRGCGCPKCNNKVKDPKDTIDDLIAVHGDKYEYSITERVKTRDRIEIKCPVHGKFIQKLNSHKNGEGCPKCSNNGKPSSYEYEIVEFLKSNELDVKHSFKDIRGVSEVDIYVPELNLAIEFNGLYWHSDKFKDSKYHLEKTKNCEKENVNLIHIFEDEWVNKKEIVKSRLLSKISKSERIYGRECEIRLVETKESSKFLEDNHIQGTCGSKVKIGLYKNNELVSLMTFGDLRKNLGNSSKKDHYELLRFCNKLNTTVVGGASKLLKYFENTFSPTKVISYADRRWSSGNLYKKLGFDNVGVSKENYFYVDRGFNKRYNRFLYRKSELVKQGFAQDKTEKQIMEERGYHRIYDCGAIKFEKNYEKLEI